MKECANCGSTDRYQHEIESKGPDGFNLLPVGLPFWRAAKFRLEVCGACGLTQWFVVDRFLENMKAHFEKCPD